MSNPTTVWLEAELFDDLGGWTLDAQFVDQMGSPYLLAVSLGEPVADATTRVDLSEGDYRLWARAKDWAPDCSPARFQVRLNGEAAGEFGASGAQGWTWEEGGIHALGGGVEVALRDLTGEYARCDAIVLSSDPDFRPADGAEELQAQRIAHGGVSAEVDELGEYGVLVVGGGVAGCVAAVAAARMGSNTALLQNRPVLGGNASTECLVPPVGQWLYSGVDPHDPLETGIVEEFRLSGRQLPSEAKLYADRLMAVCEGEANLDLHLNMHVTDVEMASAERIAGLRALEVTTGRRVHARGKLVIDCTGDATVAAAAGAEYRHGREGRDVYDETMAPEETDDLTMGCGLKYEWEEGRQTACRRDAGGPVRQHWERGQTKYQPPEWARKFEACEDFTPTRHPLLEPEADWQWKIEIGGLQDVIADAEEIRDECLRVIYGIWDHVKNRCAEHAEAARDLELAWVGHVLAKRESRRVMGDYVLRESDVIDETLLPDRVAFGGWGIDDHFPAGFYHDGDPAQHGYHDRRFSIPLRSLYSKDVENLMMAGRNLSASHVALGATRVMLTNAVMAQAVGTAAAMCARDGVSPRELAEQRIADLQQQLLKDGCHIIDLPNADPEDLARTARVTASSGNGEAVTDGFARWEHGERHAWVPDGALPQWVELELGEEKAIGSVHVVFQTKELAATAFSVTVQAGDDWVQVAEYRREAKRRHVVEVDGVTAERVRVVVEEGPDDLGVCQVRVCGEG